MLLICVISSNKTKHMKLGAHICHDKTTGPKYAKSIGANFIQIFLKNPRGYTKCKFTDTYLKEMRDNMLNEGIGCVIHSPYIINLARDPKQYQHNKGVDAIVDDMNVAKKIGAIGSVIHMGKNVKSENMSYETAFNNYVKGVNSILEKSDEGTTLILETGAGCGTEICCTMEDLGKIRKEIKDKYRDRVKFCIDTCHIFSAGYDIHDEKYIDKYEKLIEDNLGWDNVAVVHLNDSKAKLGARVDRHENIGKGNIGLKPLVKFVQLCNRHSVPMVLETPVYSDQKSKSEPFTHKDQIALIKKELKKLASESEKNDILESKCE